MGQQTDIIKLQGSVGGISFYRSNGKDLARRKRGASKSKKNTPESEQTRRRLQEFGAVAGAGASFSKALEPVKNIRSGKFHAQLLMLFRSFISKAPGEYGKRAISISQNRKAFVNMELNDDVRLDSVLRRKPAATINADRTLASTSLLAFTPGTDLVVPEGATHVQIVQFSTVVSDTVFSASDNKYQLADAAHNAHSQKVASQYIDVKSMDQVNLSTDFPVGTAPISAEVSVFQCVGVIFYRYLGEMYFPMREGKAMRILNVA